MDRTVPALIYAMVPVLLVLAGAFIVYRRRSARPSTGFLLLAALLVAVVIVSTLLAWSGYWIPGPVLVALVPIGGSVWAWYAFRSWQQTGWSRTTQRMTFSVLAAVAAIAITLAVR